MKYGFAIIVILLIIMFFYIASLQKIIDKFCVRESCNNLYLYKRCVIDPNGFLMENK